jgi:hypothetical protein
MPGRIGPCVHFHNFTNILEAAYLPISKKLQAYTVTTVKLLQHFCKKKLIENLVELLDSLIPSFLNLQNPLCFSRIEIKWTNLKLKRARTGTRCTK